MRSASKKKAAAPRTDDSHRPSDKNTARINIHAEPRLVTGREREGVPLRTCEEALAGRSVRAAGRPH